MITHTKPSRSNISGPYLTCCKWHAIERWWMNCHPERAARGHRYGPHNDLRYGWLIRRLISHHLSGMQATFWAWLSSIGGIVAGDALFTEDWLLATAASQLCTFPPFDVFMSDHTSTDEINGGFEVHGTHLPDALNPERIRESQLEFPRSIFRVCFSGTTAASSYQKSAFIRTKTSAIIIARTARSPPSRFFTTG